MTEAAKPAPKGGNDPSWEEGSSRDVAVSRVHSLDEANTVDVLADDAGDDANAIHVSISRTYDPRGSVTDTLNIYNRPYIWPGHFVRSVGDTMRTVSQKLDELLRAVARIEHREGSAVGSPRSQPSSPSTEEKARLAEGTVLSASGSPDSEHEVVILKFREIDDLDRFYDYVYAKPEFSGREFGAVGGFTAKVEMSMLKQIEREFGGKFDVLSEPEK